MCRGLRQGKQAKLPGSELTRPWPRFVALAAAATGLIVADVSTAASGHADQAASTFIAMTYNIHHGEGTDGKLDLKRIADLIRGEGADLVALQEVDRGVRRTDRRDLPKELSELTGMQSVFHNNFSFQGGEYGNAILSRYPIVWHTNHHYTMLVEGEQRGLLQARIRTPQGEVLLMVTHLDYRPDSTERLAQAKTLPSFRTQHPTLPVLIAGDFNAVPGSPTHRAMTRSFQDVWDIAGKGQGFTHPSESPRKRIDYLFTDPVSPLRPVRSWTACSVASDHCALLAEFAWDRDPPQR